MRAGADPMRRAASCLALVLVALMAALHGGCGADRSAAAPEAPPPVPLRVFNYTFWPLESLRVHYTPEFLSAANLLPAPLAHASEATVDVHPGAYITVVRLHSEHGERETVTTAEPLDEVDQVGYVLMVFFDSFRLVAPGYAMPPPPTAAAEVAPLSP